MPVETTDTEIIARFQETDTLLTELRQQAAVVREKVSSLAGHDRSLAEIATGIGGSAGDIARLADTAAQSRDALVEALETGRNLLDTVQRQAATLDPQLVVNIVQSQLEQLEKVVTDEFSGATAEFDRELVHLGQLARQVQDTLQLFDARKFLADLDNQVQRLDQQVEHLTLAAAAVNDLSERTRRDGKGGDLEVRLSAIEKRLRPGILLSAYIVLLVLVLLRG